MKILFVLLGIDIGGLEVFTIDLTKRLIEKKEKIGILTFKVSDETCAIVKNHRIDLFDAHRKSRFNYLFLFNVYKIISTFQPDIIVSLSGFAYFFVEFIKKLLHMRTPHFIVFHHPSLPSSVLNKIFMFFSRLCKAYYIFIYNNQPKEYQNAYQLSKKRSFVIHNAVDTNFFVSTKSKKDDTFTIIHVANIWPRKDQWTLLRSIVLLNESIKNWRLIFVGKEKINLLGEFEAYLRKADLLNKVDFKQVGDRAAIKKLLSQSDVFILTSIHEALPISALEAMAAGLPCILTNVGGCSEIVRDGYDGYLIDPGDEKAVADRLLRLHKEPDLLKRMSENARKTAEERFNLDKCAEKYIKIFNIVRKG